MWQVHGNKVALRVGILIAAGCLYSTNVNAQDSGGTGFTLPGVTLPQGTDEVRAADGTSCRSAVGGNGAYVDMGLVGKQGVSNNGSYYGRVVVPLGKGPKRLDCTRLYDLEVERLKLELELAKAGLGRQQDPTLDQTETSALGEDEEPVSHSDASLAKQNAKLLEEENAAEEPAVEAPVKKTKKAKTVAAVEETAPATPAKAKKLKAKKVGDADWANEGWSTDGLQAN
jgi:hypothetical protein